MKKGHRRFDCWKVCWCESVTRSRDTHGFYAGI